MAKKKNTAAFFEVLSKTRQAQKDAGLSIPKWMGKVSEGDESEEKPSVPEKGPALAPAQPGEQMLSAQAGRVRFSLGYAVCAAAAAGLLLLLVAAFWAGRATAPKTAEPFEAGVVPPHRPDVLSSSAESPALPSREKAKYNLIIERLKGSSDAELAEAQRIVNFLAERGEPADIQTFRLGGKEFYGVWSLRPFNTETGPQQVKFAERIEELGRQYFQKHRTYRFQQRRRLEDELTPSYVQHN
ncbi:MAG: hypothetical protein KAX78_11545 [Phycisphaerae bacterium]|nr:hypothetical protein [Phycisphaerae bacterium]